LPELNKKNLLRIFLCVCGVIILYWLLNETDRVKRVFGLAFDIVAPFAFGGVLAFILNVPMRAIENTLLKNMKKDAVKRIIALLLTFAAMLLVISLVFWLLIPQLITTVNSLIPSLDSFLRKTENGIKNFISKNPQLSDWLKGNRILENFSWATMAESLLGGLGNGLSSVLGSAVSAISGIFSGLLNAIIAVVFSIYCLSQKESLARQGRKILYAYLKEQTADRIIRVMRLTNTSFSNFFSGQCVEVCILGSLFAVCMAIFRMPFIPLISVLMALTAFIPLVGAWTGCAVGAFLIFVVDPMLAIWFIVMSFVIQQLENSLIYPRVVGNSVGLSGMWVLVAVAVGGELMGVLGMFLMIPVVSVIYTLLREHTNKKLAGTNVPSEKLEPQPPELKSRMKEKREIKKKKKMLLKVKAKEETQENDNKE